MTKRIDHVGQVWHLGRSAGGWIVLVLRSSVKHANCYDCLVLDGDAAGIVDSWLRKAFRLDTSKRIA